MDSARFLRGFFASPGQVGSLLPSSRVLARAVAAAVPWTQCRSIAELGAGTGRITEQLLARRAGDCALILFELNNDFRRHLETEFPGLPLYPDARQLPAALADQGLAGVDAVVAGLPLSILPDAVRESIIDAIAAALGPDGVFVAYQYAPHLGRWLRGRFREVRTRVVLQNLPPAYILVCRNPYKSKV